MKKLDFQADKKGEDSFNGWKIIFVEGNGGAFLKWVGVTSGVP